MPKKTPRPPTPLPPPPLRRHRIGLRAGRIRTGDRTEPKQKKPDPIGVKIKVTAEFNKKKRCLQVWFHKKIRSVPDDQAVHCQSRLKY